ncbi:MAG: hypothetical protein QGF47_10720 [Arenicellales bacterium]|nr:hypothetical protein [Arenicellales bacterium]
MKQGEKRHSSIAPGECPYTWRPDQTPGGTPMVGQRDGAEMVQDRHSTLEATWKAIDSAGQTLNT